MGAVEYVALLLGKYAGELAGVAHDLNHPDAYKRERGRRGAHRFLKNRLRALRWVIDRLEAVLPLVAGSSGDASSPAANDAPSEKASLQAPGDVSSPAAVA